MADIQAREHALGDTRAIARDEHGRSYWTSTDAAIDVLYHDCDPAQALPGTEPHAGRQSCSSSVAPSSAASPLPPSRITMSWFHENAGRASGPNRFIHHLVVRTRQS